MAGETVTIIRAADGQAYHFDASSPTPDLELVPYQQYPRDSLSVYTYYQYTNTWGLARIWKYYDVDITQQTP